jgi:uncharacterized protein YeaO (DUF488 family)
MERENETWLTHLIEHGRLKPCSIQIKRIYDLLGDDDGLRVLVDRLWPRGMTKEKASVDVWAKELAPTTGLRQWFGHDASKFGEFRSRYLKELDDKGDDVRKLFDDANGSPLTLLFAARDRSCNHAVVLLDYLNGMRPGPTGVAI